jgi:hypothetical protein
MWTIKEQVASPFENFEEATSATPRVGRALEYRLGQAGAVRKSRTYSENGRYLTTVQTKHVGSWRISE